MMFFTHRNFVLLSGLLVLFLLIRMLLSSLLPMKKMSSSLRISLIIALAMVAWNTLSSGKVTLFLNPLGNCALTYIVHTFCRLIINAEGCVEAVGGAVMLGFASVALVVCCAACTATQHYHVAIALGW